VSGTLEYIDYPTAAGSCGWIGRFPLMRINVQFYGRLYRRIVSDFVMFLIHVGWDDQAEEYEHKTESEKSVNADIVPGELTAFRSQLRYAFADRGQVGQKLNAHEHNLQMRRFFLTPILKRRAPD